MSRVLITAYDVNPYRGSESGMGWNFIRQAAHRHDVVAVTRENNRPAIERYLRERGIRNDRLTFQYFDLPWLLRFWKRGSRGAILYFYLWQLTVPFFIRTRGIRFDLAHSLNFHTDAVPSFLWTLGKPLVWGPLGHHPPIPASFVRPYGMLAALMDRSRWLVKRFLWHCDPFLRLSTRRAAAILCMNSQVSAALHPEPSKVFTLPSVGSEDCGWTGSRPGSPFLVLSVGRFVPLKGFDVTLRAFARAHGALPGPERRELRLVLVGRGPAKHYLRELARELHVADHVDFVDWVERSRLADLYRRASVFLFPSHEGAGMVVSEALSHGLPVLCFDNSGPGEFIDDTCGRKVAYQGYSSSIDEFSRKLLELYRGPELRDRLSRGARRRFEAAFDWEAKGIGLESIYQRVLEPCGK